MQRSIGSTGIFLCKSSSPLKKKKKTLQSHVLTGLPAGKAAAPGQGFARKGMRGGEEVRREGCSGFLYPHLKEGGPRNSLSTFILSVLLPGWDKN